jgi:hypothetical protein
MLVTFLYANKKTSMVVIGRMIAQIIPRAVCLNLTLMSRLASIKRSSKLFEKLKLEVFKNAII